MSHLIGAEAELIVDPHKVTRYLALGKVHVI